nr:hypothetical protein [Streptomyces sp. NRRL WC-3742]
MGPSRCPHCEQSWEDTEASHDRASVFFASVITDLARAPVGILDLSAFHAAFRRESASLYTTRAHPNVRASACR